MSRNGNKFSWTEEEKKGCNFLWSGMWMEQILKCEE